MKKKYALIAGLIMFVFSITSCQKDTEIITLKADAPGELSLTFDARYGNDEFSLNKEFPYTLTNADGTFQLTYSFTALRYWVSNLRLINENNEEYAVPDSYYLIEETNAQTVQDGQFTYPANKRETIILTNIPAGVYKSLKFAIGVDSKYNDNLTLKAGELGSLNGMAMDNNWMWYTSYKFFNSAGTITWQKTDGTSENKRFSWDFASNNLYDERTVELDKPLTINYQHNSSINLETDVKKILNLEYPWPNTIISQSKPELMFVLKENLLHNAISLKNTSFTPKN